MHLKKDDLVKIIAGKGKNEAPSKILRILREENKVVVEGRRLVKKHIRPNQATGEQGGIRTVEAPIHASNVMLYSQKIKKTVRTVWRYMGDSNQHYASKKEAIASFADNQPNHIQKVRYSRKSDELFT